MSDKVSRRGVLGLLGGAAVAATVPMAVATKAARPEQRKVVKAGTRVRINYDARSCCTILTARHWTRDENGWINKKWTVAYRLHDEVREQHGKHYRAFLSALRAYAIHRVESRDKELFTPEGGEYKFERIPLLEDLREFAPKGLTRT